MNAEGEAPLVAPNTWVEIKGINLAPQNDARTWQNSDFLNNQMPTQLDQVSATVNGKSAFVYYISPEQLNILMPPDAMSGPVQVVVTNKGVQTAAFTVQVKALSPSFFVFNGGPYVAAVHLDGTLVGPATLFPGASSPARRGETVVIFANGFGPTNQSIVGGSSIQGGLLSPPPQIQLGGIAANVQFAGLVVPGEFQFNVVVPSDAPAGDLTISAAYNGATTQAGALLTVQH